MPFVRELQPRELGDEDLAAAARCSQVVLGQLPCERQAAERADEAALLVGEVDRLERDRKLEAGVLHGPKHLERTDDAESAVEPAAALDGVEVRAEQERARCGVGRGQDGRVVGGTVDSRFEPRGVGPLAEPGARREMRGRERLPIDAAVGGRTDRSESVEVGSEAIGIDAKEHGGDASPDRGAASQS